MTVQAVGVAGLGLMGRGIATSLLSHGFRVVSYDTSDAARHAARDYITGAIGELVQRGGFPARLRDEWPRRFAEAAGWEAFGACDFVIETVFEDLGVKRGVFDALEAVIGPAVPIASNTSALPITLLQEGRRHPQRFVGMHWCDPCHVTRFLEVIRGEKTDDATAAAAIALGEACGKEPALVRRDVEGFIVNRLNYAMYREAFHLLESGVADVETIDRAFRNSVGLWSTVAGPFRFMDLTGLSAYAAVMRRLFPQLSNTSEVPRAMLDLMNSGAKGIANLRGFYRYTPEEVERWQRLLVDQVWAVQELQRRREAQRHPGGSDTSVSAS